MRKISGEDLVELFRERREKLQTAFERLELQRERFCDEDEAVRRARSASRGPRDPQSGRLELAGAAAGSSRSGRSSTTSRSSTSPRRRTRSSGERGRRSSSSAATGPTSTSSRRAGSRSAGRPPTATSPSASWNRAASSARSTSSPAASGPARRSAIDELPPGAPRRRPSSRCCSTSSPSLAVEVYLSFWHGLAQKLRGANEQLRTFFASERGAEAAC